MPSTAVVADTTSYLPPELIARHDIRLVSLYVGIEGEQYRESEITDLHGFYERLRASDRTVTTSQPSVGDFIAVYEPLLSEGKEIVSIHLSAGISGTHESAMQARERLAAARAAEQGASAGEARDRALALRSELRIWFAVDTLDYLRRGGRIGAARAWIGTTLKIKPILTLEEEITPVERVRTRSRAFERLMDYARQRHEAGADAWVVQHVQDPENAERLVEACRPIFGTEPVFTSEVGPVIGAHVGPGLLGVGGVSKAALEF